MDDKKLSLKVEAQTRLRLAEVLVNETENIGLAEDLLSKGVHISDLMRLMTRYYEFQRLF